MWIIGIMIMVAGFVGGYYMAEYKGEGAGGLMIMVAGIIIGGGMII